MFKQQATSKAREQFSKKQARWQLELFQCIPERMSVNLPENGENQPDLSDPSKRKTQNSEFRETRTSGLIIMYHTCNPPVIFANE